MTLLMKERWEEALKELKCIWLCGSLVVSEELQELACTENFMELGKSREISSLAILIMFVSLT